MKNQKLRDVRPLSRSLTHSSSEAGAFWEPCWHGAIASAENSTDMPGMEGIQPAIRQKLLGAWQAGKGITSGMTNRPSCIRQGRVHTQRSYPLALPPLPGSLQGCRTVRLGVLSWMWCHMPVIPAVGRLKQENCEFEASLGYVVRPYLKNKHKNYAGW
jgi:hypothetical protein